MGNSKIMVVPADSRLGMEGRAIRVIGGKMGGHAIRSGTTWQVQADEAVFEDVIRPGKSTRYAQATSKAEATRLLRWIGEGAAQ